MKGLKSHADVRTALKKKRRGGLLKGMPGIKSARKIFEFHSRSFTRSKESVLFDLAESCVTNVSRGTSVEILTVQV